MRVRRLPRWVGRRGLFFLRCFVAVVTRVGHVSQNDFVVGLAVLGSLTFGVLSAGAVGALVFYFHQIIPAVVLVALVALAVVGEGAYIQWSAADDELRAPEFESILALSEAKPYPTERANIYPGTLGGVVNVQLWRVSLKVAKPGGQADNVRVEVAEAMPPVSFLPVVPHEMHRTDGREERSLRFGDSPLWFDIIGKEIGQSRILLYRNHANRYQVNTFDGPDLLSEGESAAWWSRWARQERTELRITAVPDAPAKEVTAIYQLWLDDESNLQMRKK